MAAMGANAIETYVPWNWHETEQGQFNFKGDRDLAGFLQAAQKAGLVVSGWLLFFGWYFEVSLCLPVVPVASMPLWVRCCRVYCCCCRCCHCCAGAAASGPILLRRVGVR